MLEWFHVGDGEVEGVAAELCAVGIGQRRDEAAQELGELTAAAVVHSFASPCTEGRRRRK
jgi:hypothetical protein